MSKPIIYSDFFRGDGKSKYDLKGFDEIVGCKIHEELGTIEASEAMVKESAAIVTDLILCIVPLSDGSAYGFGDTGKIYHRTTGGTWTYKRDNANGKTLGGWYKDGYIYYASVTKLGRLTVAGEVWSDSWGTFANGDAGDPRAFTEQNDQVYISDGHYIAVVDEGGTFVANGLDIQAHHTITILKGWSDDVIFGTKVGSYIHSCQIGRWDTYSDSFNLSDPIKERGLKTFIDDDNELWVVARSRNVYWYDGARAIKRKKFKGSATISDNPFASANADGLPLFAEAKGIWALGSLDFDLPKVVHIQYVPSEGFDTVDSIGCLLTLGDQILLSWKNGASYGVDKLDTNKFDGWFTTPVTFKNIRKIIIKYAQLPGSSVITMESKLNHGSFITCLIRKNAVRKEYRAKSGFKSLSTLQGKIKFGCDGVNSPVIEYARFE